MHTQGFHANKGQITTGLTAQGEHEFNWANRNGPLGDHGQRSQFWGFFHRASPGFFFLPLHSCFLVLLQAKCMLLLSSPTKGDGKWATSGAGQQVSTVKGHGSAGVHARGVKGDVTGVQVQVSDLFSGGNWGSAIGDKQGGCVQKVWRENGAAMDVGEGR